MLTKDNDRIQSLLNSIPGAAIDQWEIDASETASLAWFELMRMARLGAAIEAMPPNSALFKHNNDTWSARSCVMDVVWNLQTRGYQTLPPCSGIRKSHIEALSALTPE
jgi:hypothetical protein